MLPVEAAIRNSQDDLGAQTDEGCTKRSPDNNQKDPSSAEGDSGMSMESFYGRHARQTLPSLPIKQWSSLFPDLQLSNTIAAPIPNDDILIVNKAKEEKRKDIRLKLKRKLQKDLFEKMKGTIAKWRQFDTI